MEAMCHGKEKLASWRRHPRLPASNTAFATARVLLGTFTRVQDKLLFKAGTKMPHKKLISMTRTDDLVATLTAGEPGTGGEVRVECLVTRKRGDTKEDFTRFDRCA